MEILIEMLVCEADVLTLPFTMLSIRLVLSATALHSNSYYRPFMRTWAKEF